MASTDIFRQIDKNAFCMIRAKWMIWAHIQFPPQPYPSILCVHMRGLGAPILIQTEESGGKCASPSDRDFSGLRFKRRVRGYFQIPQQNGSGNGQKNAANAKYQFPRAEG